MPLSIRPSAASGPGRGGRPGSVDRRSFASGLESRVPWRGGASLADRSASSRLRVILSMRPRGRPRLPEGFRPLEARERAVRTKAPGASTSGRVYGRPRSSVNRAPGGSASGRPGPSCPEPRLGRDEIGRSDRGTGEKSQPNRAFVVLGAPHGYLVPQNANSGELGTDGARPSRPVHPDASVARDEIGHVPAWTTAPAPRIASKPVIRGMAYPRREPASPRLGPTLSRASAVSSWEQAIATRSRNPEGVARRPAWDTPRRAHDEGADGPCTDTPMEYLFSGAGAPC